MRLAHDSLVMQESRHLKRWRDRCWRVLLGREYPLVRHVLTLLLSALAACGLVTLLVLGDAHLTGPGQQIAQLVIALPHP